MSNMRTESTFIFAALLYPPALPCHGMKQIPVGMNEYVFDKHTYSHTQERSRGYKSKFDSILSKFLSTRKKGMSE